MHIRSFCQKGKVFCQDGTATGGGLKGVKCQHPRPESVFEGMEFIQNEVAAGQGKLFSVFFLSVSFKLFSYIGMLNAN